MGPNKHTDAQYIQIDDSMRKVLSQLDRPLHDMDTEWIDRQLDSVQDAAAPAGTAYEQTMRTAAALDNATKVRAARQRVLKRVTAIAAGIIMVAAGTFGVANAFQWKSFLRIFSVQNGILSFQTPSEEDGKIITSGVDQDNKPSLRDETDDDTNDLTSLSSAEELLAISTAGDKAFKPLLDKYTFQSGNLYRTETDDLLNLTFLDGTGNDLNIQISTVNKEYLNHVASSVFFEIDDGSQKNVRIGDDTVITCTNLDVNTVQWVTQYGYCHLWSKASHEELLNIAKMLLDAGLKPV